MTAACASAGAQPPSAVAVAPPAGALDEAEKNRAELTILEAAAAGESRRWDSGRPGYYGVVEPGPAQRSDAGVCRDYAHTIFIDGLARQEKGRACRPPGGVWRIAQDPA
ncbi:MAG: hypothetical protein J0H41_02525 [Rhizobiales bacterium]|nr:hypothetical protein [Hyphomicrobiales bacterium]